MARVLERTAILLQNMPVGCDDHDERGRPVVEGKAMLLKKFASLKLTFCSINLKDIKTPECSRVERKLHDYINHS